jgi:hypothetical protein
VVVVAHEAGPDRLIAQVAPQGMCAITCATAAVKRRA